MADVRSKNVYELLGNDPELDPNRAPEPPTKAIDRPAQRVGKRDAPKELPAQPQAENTTNNRRGQRTQDNEAAFRDRNAGRGNNRDRPVDEKEGERRGANRGDRGGRPRHDRQSRTGQTDSRKQLSQGWGGQTGEKEFDDEKAGQNIAKNDENDTAPQTPAEEDEADKAKSFADYLAEKAAQGDLSAKPVRSANEGSKVDDKWANAKELKHDEEEAEYIKGKDNSKGAKGIKQRKEKNYLDVDMRFVEAPRGGGNGPRGGGRGAARGPRGAGRGGRGAPAGAGRGAPAGASRGAPAGASRGAAGATTGGRGTVPVTVDEKNFPSLGAK